MPRLHIRRFLNQIDDLMAFEPLIEAARAVLVAEGYDPAYGARPLRWVIQRRVENAVSKRVLAGDFAEGDTVPVVRTSRG